jgi:peptidoglycan/LPS O-acetylase OafA/YrhL
MKNTIHHYSQNKDNNFNLIRFIAAFLVLFSHSFIIVTGDPSTVPLKLSLGITWGGVAVDVFFITSGFLIAGSFFNRKNLLTFIWARVLRIYPALTISMVFCVFVIGIYFTNLSSLEYLSNIDTYKYLIKNIILFFGVNYNLPGVFTENPYVNSVNGSLWTLPFEVKMYAYLTVIGIILAITEKLLAKRITLFVFFFLAFIALTVNVTNHFFPYTSLNFSRLFYMFFVGVAYYKFRDKIVLSHRFFFLLATILLVSTLNKEIFYVIYTCLLPYAVFYLAYIPKGGLRKFNTLGDYSYGIYIYAFPIQQSLVATMPNLSIFSMVIYSGMITLIMSYLSWHYIESKALKLKNTHYFITKYTSFFTQKNSLRSK